MTTTRVAELQSALEQKTAFIKEGMDKGVKIDGNNVEVKSEDAKALRQAYADAQEIKGLIDMENFGADAEKFLNDMKNPEKKSSAMSDAAGGSQRQQIKSLGQAFVESEEFKDLQSSGATTMRTPFEMKGNDMVRMGSGYGTKDVYTGSVDPVQTLGFGQTQRDPMVPRAQRALRVRDLFPVAATSANSIDFFRVLGFVDGDPGKAATVPEVTGSGASQQFGLKPQSKLRFESAQATVRTIAHWEAAHRNILQDEPQLESTINGELLYGLSLAEDDQILNGDGQGDNLLGLLNTPNVQQYTQVAGDRKSDALRRAATLAVIANYAPTGYVMHPYDWEDIELQKATGDGQYMLVTNFAVGAETTVWRQPVVETPAMAEGTFLTGAFGIGAQLYDRQVASVRISEQHADFFIRNAVVILAEERLALATKRPESFVKGTFTDDGGAGEAEG